MRQPRDAVGHWADKLVQDHNKTDSRGRHAVAYRLTRFSVAELIPAAFELTRIVPILLFVLWTVSVAPSMADEPTDPTANASKRSVAAGSAVIRNLRSPYLILHTDLDRRAARKTLSRLDAKLREVSSYWSRAVSQPIECFVVVDLDNWSEAQLDDTYAAEVIRRVGGFAMRSGPGNAAAAKMYSSADLNIALHELVHAYCLAAFPDSGPDWYKEGMAVYFANLQRSKPEVRIKQEVVDYLRNATPRSARAIYEDRGFTDPITKMIRRSFEKDEVAPNQDSQPSPDQDQVSTLVVAPDSAVRQVLTKANESYRWSWALCHFLVHNENYSGQFAQLGKAYLAGKRPPFDKVFAHNSHQLELEFRQFVCELGSGYRVDLCRWNWSDAPKPMDAEKTTKFTVYARRGLQTSSLQVFKGTEYAILTDGHWSVSPDGAQLNANGRTDGVGRLTAAVLTNVAMGPAIDIGAEGTFIAADNGMLFFRCCDSWQELGDNRGHIRVSVRQVTK